MKAAILLIAFAALASTASAKLPPLSDEAKAKAAEAAAKAAHATQVANYQLCQSMDKVAAAYLASAKKAGKDVKPTATAPCADPGPFTYVAPAARPLEAAGAHSPTATAAQPPSTKATSAEIAPKK